MTPSNSDSLAHDDADAVEANGSCIRKRRKRLSSHEKENAADLQVQVKWFKKQETKTTSEMQSKFFKSHLGGVPESISGAPGQDTITAQSHVMDKGSQCRRKV